MDKPNTHSHQQKRGVSGDLAIGLRAALKSGNRVMMQGVTRFALKFSWFPFSPREKVARRAG